MSTPPVSTSRKRRPVHSATSSLRSRVVPCGACPAPLPRGRQTVQGGRLPDVGEADDGHGPLQALLAHSGGTAPGGRPSACTLASQSNSTLIRRSISAVAFL